MRNFKLFAVLTTLLFLVTGQMSFAQGTKFFGFDCPQSPPFPFPNCSFASGGDGATNSTTDFTLIHGRPRIVSDCSTNSLLLNYWHSAGSSDGSDGLCLKYPFAANKSYKISYRVASVVTDDMPFEVNFIASNLPTSSTQGTLTDPAASTVNIGNYALPGLPPNAVGMGGRMTNGDFGGCCGVTANYVTNNDACTFQEREFTYAAGTSSACMYIRLEASGWSYPSTGRVQLRFDYIKIEELCGAIDPDFKLKIIGTTRTSAGGARQTQNFFNFEVDAVEQSATSYKLEVFKSNSSSNNSPNNIVFDTPAACTVQSSNYQVLATAAASSIRATKGFLAEETGTGVGRFYQLRLSFVKCGLTYTSCRVVKACYNGNFPVTSNPYNLSFNFTVTDDGVGPNRTRTFRGTSIGTGVQQTWIFGSDDVQNGTFFSDLSTEIGANNSNVMVKTLMPPVTSTGKFVRVKNFYATNGTSSTTDVLVLYDKIGCDEATFQDASSSSFAMKSVTTTNSNGLNVFPNPTSEEATIEYNLSASSKVDLYVTDVVGKKITQLVQDQPHEKGHYQVLFSRKDMTNGIYFVVMESAEGKVIKKLMLN